MPKQLFGPKLAGSGLKSRAPKKLGPLLFYNRRRTSYLVHNLGPGSRVSEVTFGTKNGRGCARGAPPKMLGQLFISATIGARDFKFGI